ncbi:BglII/BstYI family type II restriction endonuclease [Thalassobellus citreus]|uniref:BglII/BstYI family type II restriction endonuclease n=1 Tax=Thalassobellus citreus TaxID=3367752 RepID=UPI0037982B6A
MNYKIYVHRYADIILNSDYELRQELEQILNSISYKNVSEIFDQRNIERKEEGKKLMKGKQPILNERFKAEFSKRGWEEEKSVFGAGEDNDLRIDFWKRKVGVDVAFNHRSFIGGDLLRFQAAAEVVNEMKIGIYICATKNLLNEISPFPSSLVNFERTQWYLEKFYPVLTVPIYLIGIDK